MRHKKSERNIEKNILHNAQFFSASTKRFALSIVWNIISNRPRESILLSGQLICCILSRPVLWVCCLFVFMYVHFAGIVDNFVSVRMYEVTIFVSLWCLDTAVNKLCLNPSRSVNNKHCVSRANVMGRASVARPSVRKPRFRGNCQANSYQILWIGGCLQFLQKIFVSDFLTLNFNGVFFSVFFFVCLFVFFFFFLTWGPIRFNIYIFIC